MKTRESVLREFVEQYDIKVPDKLIENELQYVILDMKHRMQYDTLTGGTLHLNVRAELDEKADDLRKIAFYEAKLELVLKILIAEHSFEATREELEAEASAMSEMQNTTIEQIKMFFGDDLQMLQRDLTIRKAIDWVYEQYQIE